MQILDGEDALYRAAYTSFPRWFESTGLHQVFCLVMPSAREPSILRIVLR
jgi:hypothetical protein